jgi:hypothetical protein
MGTSVKSYLAFLVVVVLLETCASEANAALRVQNDLSSTITVTHPPVCPGCVPRRPCPLVCFGGIIVESGKEESLNPSVPYPLSYLKIGVQDEVYCVPQTDLIRLTATALLQIGPGGCGQAFPNSTTAVIVDGSPSDLYVTCLQLCSA